MPVVINTNGTAAIAANNLVYASSQLTKSLNRLSSGSRIMNASDDAGGMAVAMKLTATADRDSDLLNNMSNVTSFVQTQDGALSVAGTVLDRMSQLATLYADPTKNSSDLANYDDEFTQLNKEISTLGSQSFNGINLFGTGSLTVATTDDLGTASAITIVQQNLLGTGGPGVMATLTGASSLSGITIGNITAAIQQVASMRAVNGAEQSQLSFASTLLTTNQTNLQSAVSVITDVDVAQESTKLAKWNVLVQAGTSMLTQANQSAQQVLKLITG